MSGNRSKPFREGQRQSGFTLVELLVVIAIISILAGILFPVFSQVRERARQTACLSNLRQISLGMQMYQQDNDERLPPVVTYQPGETKFFTATWMYRLTQYVKEDRIFLDPSSSSRNPDWQHSSDLMYNNYGLAPSTRVFGSENSPLWLEVPGFGAGWWEGLGGFAGNPHGWYTQTVDSLTVAQIARPVETILLCDQLAFDWGVHQQQIYLPEPRHMREGDIHQPDGTVISEGRINCLFADGHIQSLKHSQFWSVLPNYTRRNGQTQNVFRYFWPYE